MDIERYLARIRYHGDRVPTLPVLAALHRHHLHAVPYENLDIHLGRRLTLDLPQIFAKLVLERRGGWCYEMNGLFAWALATLGFDVTLVAATVGPRGPEHVVDGNHLVLLVQLDRPFLADVGFGDGFIEPLPLEPGRYRRGFLDFRLERIDDRWWFHNHQLGAAEGFDFVPVQKTLGDFAKPSDELQTSPTSGFVRTATCQRHHADRLVVLRGAVLQTITPAGATHRVIPDAEAYDQVLRQDFDLKIGPVGSLWDRVWARHLEWEGG